jgi:hypothetical protein
MLELISVPAKLPKVIEIGEVSEGVEALISQGPLWITHENATDWFVNVLPRMRPV